MTTTFKPELLALAEQFGTRCKLIFEDRCCETVCFVEGGNNVCNYNYEDREIYKKSVQFSFFSIDMEMLQKIQQVLYKNKKYIPKRIAETALVDEDVVTGTMRIFTYEQ